MRLTWAGGQFIVTETPSGADLWNAATRAHASSIGYDPTTTLLAVSPDGKEILTNDSQSDPYIWRFP